VQLPDAPQDPYGFTGRLHWNIKVVLAYIQFRLNLKEFDWTFSQANIVKELGLDKSRVSRIFKRLISANVLKYERSIIKRKLELKVYSINVESFKAYISQSHSESVTVSQCNSDSLTVRASQSQVETYNKDIEQIFKNNDNENKEAVSSTNTLSTNPSTVIINPSIVINPQKPIVTKEMFANAKHTPEYMMDLINNPLKCEDYIEICELVKKYSELFPKEILQKVYNALNKQLIAA
jgi:DNA-binding MarR family transcriptional regulator